MDVEARLLYFMVGMNAYNKGIVINARSLSKMICGTEEALQELVDSGYLSERDDGSYQILDWDENQGIAENTRQRRSYAYRIWRDEVVNRDKVCQICGSTLNLNAHHIKPFSKYPELRLDPTNGMALCQLCHRELHRQEREDGEEEDV